MSRVVCSVSNKSEITVYSSSNVLHCTDAVRMAPLYSRLQLDCLRQITYWDSRVANYRRQSDF
jgi:hypothetical protein